MFLLLGDPGACRGRCASGGERARRRDASPLTLESWRLIEGSSRGWISRAAKRCVAALKDGRPAPPAVLELLDRPRGSRRSCSRPGHDGDRSMRSPALARRRCAPTRRVAAAQREHARLPAIRADPFCVPDSTGSSPTATSWVEPDALALLQEIREQHARAAGLVALSAATDASSMSPGLGGELKPFQRAGVSYLLEQRRAFLADEQGLGKTIEALATLEADGAYPAIVVCPASLKLNWLREIERWLPARTRAGARRHGARRAGPRPPDITVVNYDIVAARLTALARARAARARARRVPLLQERRRQAHAGGRSGWRASRAARRPRARADGHAGDEPPARADRPAAHHRTARATSARARSSASASAAPTRTCACTGTCARAASCGD